MAKPKTIPTKANRAWIMIPAVIVIAAVIGVLVSSFQKEVGLAAPGDSGRAAVATAAEALQRQLSPAADSDYVAYADFSAALLVATVAHKNMVIGNTADTRLDHLLISTLNCLAAVREAWQLDLDQAWDPRIYGSADYWRSIHPLVQITTSETLTAADVRRFSAEQAAKFVRQAIDLAR